MRTESFTIRYYRAGDETRILRLFHDVFGPGYRLEDWQWQFLSNPFSRPIIWVAENQDGELAGHYCLIPVPYHHEGRSLKAAFSILSMVHPNFQRRGLLKKLAEACDRQLQDDGIALGLTFLNDNSLPVYTSHFGWQKVFRTLPVYFRILDARVVMQRYTPARLPQWLGGLLVDLGFFALTAPRALPYRPSHFPISELGGFDARFDTLWAEFSRCIHSGVERSRRYLDWRFGQNPKQYRIFAAENGGQLLGFAVVRAEVKFGVKMGYVAELAFLDKQIGTALLAHACQALRRAGCGMVTGLFAGDARCHGVLRQNRFLPMPGFLMPHGIHFCEKQLSPDLSPTPGHKVYLSWSDHDVV